MKTFAIFGPPGTGKTSELLRLMREVRDSGVNPDHISFASFTRAAANEALSRLGVRRSDKIATIHSLCFRALEASPIAMVDPHKLRKFGAKIGVPFSGVTNDEYGDRMEEGDKYLAILNLARARMAPLRDTYFEQRDRPGDFAQFMFCAESYSSWKDSLGYLDFTDLLEQYLQDPINIGARVMFFDEAQDLSPLQWAVVRAMVSFPQVERVYIAGDDDQAIYEWAGADPHGMAKFATAYDAETSVLAQSYRVPLSVHNVARGIVSQIKSRVQKRYRAAPRHGVVTRYNNGFSEHELSHGEDVLILCRSNAALRELEAILTEARLPHRNEGSRPSVYDSPLALAIRALTKGSAGKPLTPKELAAISKVGTAETRQDINDGRLERVLSRGVERSLTIPLHKLDFYREADFSQTPTVRLSTIHSAKGREAERVVLHCGVTGRTRADMSVNPDQEHRVWYVGVTRAKERLDVVTGNDDDYELSI